VASRTFSSLQVRNFRLFFFGQLTSNTGNWLTNVALTLLVLHLTDSGVAVGVLTACQYGPILVLSPFAGAVADRSDKHRLLYVTQGLEMLESVVLALLAFQHHPPVGALYATATAGGVVLAFDNPLRRSFVTEMVPPDQVPNAVVLYSTIVNGARVVGPALAGALVVSVGYGWCFAVDAVSYVAVLGALWAMRPNELRRIPPAPRAKGQVREGLRYVLSTPALWIPFVMLGIVGVLGYNFNVTLPLFVTRTLHGGDGAFTLVYSVMSAGALLGALAVAHRNLVRVRDIVLGSALLGAAILLLAATWNVALAVPASFLIGGTGILYMTTTTAIVQVRADPHLHGRVLALQTVLLVGTAPLGGPLLGWMADELGARAPLLLGAAACLVAAAWGQVMARRHRADTGPAVPATVAPATVTPPPPIDDE
jgi:MFS family permease